MRAIEAGVRLTLKNILLLTDFSEPSELAVPFAIAIAREYESKVYAMHVLTPVPLAYATPESAAAAIEGLEEGAQAGMLRVDPPGGRAVVPSRGYGAVRKLRGANSRSRHGT